MNAVMETSPEVIESRQALTERRIRFIDFYRNIERHTRQVQSDEEGSKIFLKRLKTSMTNLYEQVLRYSDVNSNEAQISTAIQSVKDCVGDLRTLDPRLNWSVGLVIASCDPFQGCVNEKFPVAKQPQQPDPATINPVRMKLLDMTDELNAKLLTLGDWSHGGITERRVVITKAGDLRAAVHADMTADLSDSAKLATMVRDVMQAVSDLGSLPSKVTGQVGFMRASMPAIQAQSERILAVLASAAPPMRTRHNLSIKP